MVRGLMKKIVLEIAEGKQKISSHKWLFGPWPLDPLNHCIYSLGKADLIYLIHPSTLLEDMLNVECQKDILIQTFVSLFSLSTTL